MRRDARRGLLLALLTCGLLILGLAEQGLAHGALRRSTPAAGARLDTALTSLRLEFTEAVEARFVRLVIRDSSGGLLEQPSFEHAADRRIVTVTDPGLARLRGAVELQWTVTGADGHPVDGTLRFYVDAPAPVAAPVVEASADLPSAPAPPLRHGWGRVDGLAATTIRWLQYVAMLAVLGAWVAAAFVLPRARVPAGDTLAALERSTLQFGAAATVTLAGALVLRLLAQHSALGVSGLTGLRDVLVATNVGRGGMLALLGAIVAHVSFHRSRRAGPALAGAAGLVAIGAATMGHAMASPSPTMAVVSAAMHVIGAGAWIGTLGWLVVIAVPTVGKDGALRARLLRSFSATALIAVGVVGLSGAANAWRFVGSFDALSASDYGRMLMVKLAVLSIVALTGLYNWRTVLPRVDSDAGGHRLKVSAAVELTVALVVLAVTARLVVLPATGLMPS